MFLSKQEIEELTGYKRHADQRRWLTTRGWLFEEAATGRPIVSKAYAEMRLSPVGAHKPRASSGPNIAAIRRKA